MIRSSPLVQPPANACLSSTLPPFSLPRTGFAACSRIAYGDNARHRAIFACGHDMTLRLRKTPPPQQNAVTRAPSATLRRLLLRMAIARRLL